jgi:hypothetical protein
MSIKLQVRAVEITCRPLPRPSAAPSMIPGKSLFDKKWKRHERLGQSSPLFTDSRAWHVQDLDTSSPVLHGPWDTSECGKLIGRRFALCSSQRRQQRRLSHGRKAYKSDASVSRLGNCTCLRLVRIASARSTRYGYYTIKPYHQSLAQHLWSPLIYHQAH